MKFIPMLLGMGLMLAIAAACLFAPGYYAFVLGTLATTTLAGIGLNILLGLAGEVSLGQAGFLAIGAYGVGILTTKVGLYFWEALPLAVILAGALSAVLSIPALRVTGPYLAMVTIAFGFIVESVTVEWQSLTGGASGIVGIPAPFGTGGIALLACALCAAALAFFHRLALSPIGLAMQAAASAPAAARSIGIALLPVRTMAFVLSAIAAGLAGGLQAALTGFIAPSSFPFSQSILFLLVVILGGAGHTLGPLLGAAVVVLLPEILAGLAEYRLLVFGGGLLIVLLAAPSGIAGAIARLLPERDESHVSADSGPALARLGRSQNGLRAKNVSVAFGGVVAASDISLSAKPGFVTSVIGPNGAGKTTLLNIISGFQPPDSGVVEIGGQEVTGQPPPRVARAGLARTFQTAQLFPSLSVLDNVRLGLLRGAWRGKAPAALARSLLRFVGYTGPETRLAAALPHVDRRLVEIARALATAPAIVLLDEPAAGLDNADTEKLGSMLQSLARAGLAVVLVEHDMTLVMSISDEVVVLDAGRRIAAGPPAAIRADPLVKAAYLGDGVPERQTEPRKAGARLLDVKSLNAGYGTLSVLSQIALSVRRGETVAILGANGAGKSTLMKALSGLIRPVSGEIAFNGKDLTPMAAHRVARAGLILVPEGRQVFPHLTVAENLRLGASRRGRLEPEEIEAMLRRFPRLRPRLHTAAALLSGGEQQMLAIARGLLAHPTILLLDEPSLGLAPAVVSELFDHLLRMREEEITLLIVDQMADHVLGIADRGYVLSGGRVVSEGSALELRNARLDDAYLGAHPAGVN